MNLYEIIWLSTFPSVAMSWYTLLKESKGYINNEPICHNPYPKIIFLYAARKVTGVLVDAVNSIPIACDKEGLKDYEIMVVTNSKSEVSIKNANIIVTPREYKCKSFYKARQLNYALRYLPNNKDTWILHLDEDAKIVPQTISAIINYIKNGGNPIANGASYFPYKGNIWASFIEAQRYWTFYWIKWQMKNNWCLWANGSNLLVRSDIEHGVGWDFPNIKYSEDTRFIYEANKKYGDVTGWHGGITIELPPKSIKSAIKQRMRWFYGGLLQLPHVPLSRLPERIYRSITWVLGLILTILFPLGIIGISFGKPLFMTNIMLLITGFFWIARYQIGLYLNNKYSDLSLSKKIGMHLLFIPLTPIVDFICSVPTVLGIIFRPKEFVITEK